jgi:drug/metabolite transporter superfamily protein YnfA
MSRMNRSGAPAIFVCTAMVISAAYAITLMARTTAVSSAERFAMIALAVVVCAATIVSALFGRCVRD